jgi:hypothetical protein
LLSIFARFAASSARDGTRLATWSEESHFSMKATVAAVFLFLVIAIAHPTSAQAPLSSDEQELVALITQVQTQQSQLLANQTKIEAKLAEIAETIRVARLFSARGK